MVKVSRKYLCVVFGIRWSMVSECASYSLMLWFSPLIPTTPDLTMISVWFPMLFILKDVPSTLTTKSLTWMRKGRVASCSISKNASPFRVASRILTGLNAREEWLLSDITAKPSKKSPANYISPAKPSRTSWASPWNPCAPRWVVYFPCSNIS